MSKEYNSALQARVEQFLKEKNISQAKAAPLMGISQTALSQYRRSMYDNGDIAALESKLEEFFRTQEEQEVNTEKALPYARAYQAEVQMLNMAQENFRRMMDELDKYPDLDTTEAIIRLTSQNLLTALANTSEEDWQGVSVDKMLREANALVRAAAYKKRVEIQNQDTIEAGLVAVKSLVWEAMAKERPDLYRQVNEFLNSKKQDGLEARQVHDKVVCLTGIDRAGDGGARGAAGPGHPGGGTP